MIFKIISRKMWDAACVEGAFLGSDDDVRDGYIHFSAPGQVAGTARKYFRGVPDLLLVAFDEATLGPALKWEPSRGGELFPHLYAPLPTRLAVWQRPLDLAEDGAPLIPEDALAC